MFSAIRYVLDNQQFVSQPECHPHSLFEGECSRAHSGLTLELQVWDHNPDWIPPIHHHYDEVSIDAYVVSDLIFCREDYNLWTRTRRWTFSNVDLVKSSRIKEGHHYQFAFEYMRDQIISGPDASHMIPQTLLYREPPSYLRPKNDVWSWVCEEFDDV